MTAKILCVDDEALVLSGLRRTLRGRYDLELAEGPEEALRALKTKGPFAVVLSDMRMPNMDGAEFLAVVGRLYPDMVRMMLTGNSDLMTAVRAVNEGNILRFLNKPCSPQELTQALDAGIKQYNLICAERQVLEQTLNGCVKVLSEILSLADPQSFQDSDSLKLLARQVAESLGTPKPWEVEMATMLSQLGRVTIPAEVLERAMAGEPLSKEEAAMMGSIPSTGATMIEGIPRLDGVAEIVRQQEQDWSSGEAVHGGAQILRVLQEMKALARAGSTNAEALQSLAGKAGGLNPTVISAVATCIGEQDQCRSDRGVPFEELRPGNVLAADLVTMDGRMILSKGQLIGQVLMERLRNHQTVSGFQEPILIDVGGPKQRRAA